MARSVFMPFNIASYTLYLEFRIMHLYFVAALLLPEIYAFTVCTLTLCPAIGLKGFYFFINESIVYLSGIF